MITVNGLFDIYSDADNAVEELHKLGLDSGNISVIAHDVDRVEPETNASEGAVTGASVGGAVGGLGGLLAGVGMLAIPGVGPVVAAGWLAATLAGVAAGAVAGGAAGGIIGALSEAGVPEEDAHFYAESLRRGSTLVSVRAPDNQANDVRSILMRNRAVDPAARRLQYESEGWTTFDPDLPTYSNEERRAEYERRNRTL